MSKERARRREVREAERAAALAEAERRRARQARWSRLRPTAPALPRRSRRPARYGALPLRVRGTLAVGWLALQLLAWQLTDVTAQRLGFALLTLLALPLAVVLLVPTSVRKSHHS